MIGHRDLHTTAANPNFEMGTLYVRQDSAANVALLDVPRRSGIAIARVWMRVTNCDGVTAAYDAVRTGTMWVADVPGTHFATPGEVPGGVEVWASGDGADGEPYAWSIGTGSLCVREGDSGTPMPGNPWTAIKLRETAPTNPVYGDAMISSGALYVWDGSQWVGGGGGGGGIVDDTVTRTSSNAVKSSGIWSAIWGTLTALPTGFTALYDWIVEQLAGKVSKSGGTMTGELKLKGTWLQIEDAETLADMGGIYIAGDTTSGGTVLRLVQWLNGGMQTVALTAGNAATKADIPAASTDTPLADGTASAGSSAAYARGDHRHPTDTSRQASITASGILKGNGSGGVTAAVAGTDYQAPLTIDPTPTASSTNPVQSGGVKTALDDKADVADLRYAKRQCVVAANPLPDAFFPITFTYNGVPYTASSNADLTYNGDASSYYVQYNLPGGGSVSLAYVAAGVWDLSVDVDDLAVNGFLIDEGVVVPLLDRAGQLLDAGAYTASGNATVCFVPPPAVSGRLRDCLLDVDNSGGVYSANLEFAGLGTTFVLAPPDGDDLAEMTSVDGGKQARFYFTETALVSNNLPVISVQRITLGAVATAITRGS